MVAYVVDSNCFIHMGGMATTTILNDLKSALKQCTLPMAFMGKSRTSATNVGKQTQPAKSHQTPSNDARNLG